MDNRLLKYIYDIKTSISSIKEFISKINTFEDYKSNKLVKRAVEREFEIIGETLNNALKIDNNLTISDSKKIISFRNYIIHGYADISDKVVYSIIENNLNLLEKEINILLNLK
ncbi:MAG TPA: DUF86 domain-containing protein [Spirochaetota bacterium]|mgnify:CR=1 FL=1|nr:DUF86 domain-containing protein [Spirochaetota bacterium]